jgi:hypothetical protein
MRDARNVKREGELKKFEARMANSKWQMANAVDRRDDRHIWR